MTEKNFLKGFPLSGEEIKNLKDKTFTILDVRQELKPKYNKPDEQEVKTILFVKVTETEEESDYYANQTSVKTLIRQFGTKDINKWIGQKSEWITKDSTIGKDDVVIPFVKELKEFTK